MDLPNNADVVLSPAHNLGLQVITTIFHLIYNTLSIFT